MAKTLEEMVAKGERKIKAKEPTMKANYDSAKPRAKSNFGALPFGPRTKAAYNAGMDAGVYRTDFSKWGANWRAAVTR